MNDSREADGRPLWFDDLRLGQVWISGARTLTETDIVNFACHTGDFDPLHVDRVYASQSTFRQPIAHGLLGLAWVAGLGSHFPRVHTAAFVRIAEWNFLRPMMIGDTVHVRNEIVELDSSGRRRGKVVWKRELLNHDQQVVQEGRLETLVMKRPPATE